MTAVMNYTKPPFNSEYVLTEVTDLINLIKLQFNILLVRDLLRMHWM